MNKFINILQFLTRITINKNVPYEKNMGSGLIYFPVVGAVLGAIMILVYLILSMFFKGMTAVLVITFVLLLLEVILTGGLHIDGFGDTFDGLFSYRSKDEILRIMKDPRMGTNGILAIVFLILFKFIGIFILVSKKEIWPLFLMPIYGRYVAVVLSYKTTSARVNGMGNMFIGKCDVGTLLSSTALVTLFSLIAAMTFSGSILIVMLSVLFTAVIFVLANVLEFLVYRKIDGLTGDILGCGIELGEMIFLIYMMMIV